MAVESCVDGVEIFVWVVAVAFDGCRVVMDACCCLCFDVFAKGVRYAERTLRSGSSTSFDDVVSSLDGVSKRMLC